MMRVERLKKSHPSWKSDLIQLMKFLQQHYKRDFKTFFHDTDYFEKSFRHLEKNDLEKLKSLMDPIRPLVDHALDS